jgi:hypothetical protein
VYTEVFALQSDEGCTLIVVDAARKHGWPKDPLQVRCPADRFERFIAQARAKLLQSRVASRIDIDRRGIDGTEEPQAE